MSLSPRQLAGMAGRAAPRAAGLAAGLLLLSSDGALPTAAGAATFVLSLPRRPRQWARHVREGDRPQPPGDAA